MTTVTMTFCNTTNTERVTVTEETKTQCIKTAAKKLLKIDGTSYADIGIRVQATGIYQVFERVGGIRYASGSIHEV